MAQQSARRGRENQCFPQCFEHALDEMEEAREFPHRPAAAQRRTTGRTDGSIRRRATAILKFSLAAKGASTDGKRQKIQYSLALEPVDRGETAVSGHQAAEPA
jgi:hypothetical protein